MTDYPRLLCIKETPEKISIKSEVFLGASARTAPRREGVSTFVSVEPSSKDSNAFTVKTVSEILLCGGLLHSLTPQSLVQTTRNYKYEEPFGHAARWIRELRDAHRVNLAAPQPRR